MAARRCSDCSIDYPTDHTGPCVVCDGSLSYFSNCEPTEDLADAIAKAAWRDTGSFKLYGGATMMERFEKTLDSLRGADDFLVECSDFPAPTGNE